MKLLVFSDSHGMPLYMRETLESTETWMPSFFSATGKTIFK